MPEPESPHPIGQSVQQILATLETHIKEMRRDLSDTADLINRLRDNCFRLQANIDAAEREHARLVSQI